MNGGLDQRMNEYFEKTNKWMDGWLKECKSGEGSSFSNPSAHLDCHPLKSSRGLKTSVDDVLELRKKVKSQSKGWLLILSLHIFRVF